MIQIALDLSELCLLIGLEVTVLIIGETSKCCRKSLAPRAQDTHSFVLVQYFVEENLQTTGHLR